MKPQNIQKNTWLVLTVLLLLIVLSNLEYHEPVTNNSLIRIHVLANRTEVHAQQGQVAYIMSQRVDAKLLDRNAVAALKVK